VVVYSLLPVIGCASGEIVSDAVRKDPPSGKTASNAIGCYWLASAVGFCNHQLRLVSRRACVMVEHEELSANCRLARRIHGQASD
jgi:hypothetical protein